MTDIKYEQFYGVSEAERGRFVVIEPTSLSPLLSASRGKYAVLTYNVNDASSLGTSGNPLWTNISTVVSSVEFDLSGNLHIESVDSILNPISSYVLGPVSSYSLTPISSIQIAYVPLNSTQVKSVVCTTTAEVVHFSPYVQQLEIANNSTDTIYFLLSNTTDYSYVTGYGLPLDSTAYYSNVGYIDYVTIGATVTGSDVRIIGRS